MRFFLTFKPIRISVIHRNIICTSLKVMHFWKKLEGMAQNLGLPRPFQFLSSQGLGSLTFWVRPFYFCVQIAKVMCKQRCFYSKPLSLMVLKWGHANWFLLSIFRPLRLRRSLSGLKIKTENQLAWPHFNTIRDRG